MLRRRDAGGYHDRAAVSHERTGSAARGAAPPVRPLPRQGRGLQGVPVLAPDGTRLHAAPAPTARGSATGGARVRAKRRENVVAPDKGWVYKGSDRSAPPHHADSARRLLSDTRGTGISGPLMKERLSWMQSTPTEDDS